MIKHDKSKEFELNKIEYKPTTKKFQHVFSGHVELLQCSGSDLFNVNVARVSMAKWNDEWQDGKDDNLTSYLLEHDHFTCFTHSNLTLRIKMPIFVARQWFKHQVGFTRNEQSLRYIKPSMHFYYPEIWREAPETVKQGSKETSAFNKKEYEQVTEDYHNVLQQCVSQYNSLIEKGVCPEQARMILPLSTYVEFIETGSLAGYLRLMKLRCDEHAQWETRQYANAVSCFIKDNFPVAYSKSFKLKK